MSSGQTIDVQSVRVPAGTVYLDGDLVVPGGAKGLVMFAHGSGSGRNSPRNRFVAESLNARGFGTLLLDLLTPKEEEMDERTRRLRFDIPMLARRLCGAADWLEEYPQTSALHLGLFGSSTGAAAALIVAAQRRRVQAVVSRGGRPDLAGEALPQVQCPVLLMVGGWDEDAIGLNREALHHMRTLTRLTVVPGATHLFEEAGKLEDVARLAGEWFEMYLS